MYRMTVLFVLLYVMHKQVQNDLQTHRQTSEYSTYTGVIVDHPSCSADLTLVTLWA